MPLKIAVFGASGKMGTQIVEFIKKDRKLKLVESYRENPNLIIDFSSAEGTKELLKWLKKHPIPLVCGTTGLSSETFKSLKFLSKKTKVFWAPNVSPGVAILREALQLIGRNLPNFKIEINEIHHTQKKDKPSGTALAIFKDLQPLRSKAKAVKFPESVRRGKVFGVHRIKFNRPDEHIWIEHKAYSRKLFSKEAVNIAKWLATKSRPGWYTMADYLHGTGH